MFKQISTIEFEGVQVPVYVTDEYDKFHYDTANRDVAELQTSTNLHAEKIKASIEKNKYLFSLVICNEKMEIIDGQHRVAALRALGLPVYFVKIKGYGGPQIQALNEYSKNWKKLDFAHYFAVKGKPDYERFLRLHEEYPSFSPGTLATLISTPDARKPEVFNAGIWQIRPRLTDNQIRLFITRIMELAEVEPKVTNRSCAEALWRIMLHTKYDHKRMLTSFENYAKVKFQAGMRTPAYMHMFSVIYNHGRVKANAVTFYTAKDLELMAKR